MERGQMIFYGIAAIIVLFEMIKGWRLGLVRQLVRFGALAAAYCAANYGAASTVPILRPLGYPDFILRLIGGVGLFILVYIIISAIGGVLFKRTDHQEVGIVWFFFGATGALLGIAFGLILVLLLADTIRILGNFAESGVLAGKPQPSPSLQIPPLTTEPEKIKTENVAVTVFVELKRSLESGVPGEILKTIDPVPKRVYAISNKLGRTLANSESMERFLSYPAAKVIIERPEVQAVAKDPEIMNALRDHKYSQLLKNDKFVKAANNPKVGALLKQFDLEKALDYALKK